MLSSNLNLYFKYLEPDFYPICFFISQKKKRRFGSFLNHPVLVKTQEYLKSVKVDTNALQK